MRKALSCLLVILLMFSLGGCWDQIEIQDRAFIQGIGIDLAEDPEHPDHYLITLEIPKLGASAQGESGGVQGNGGGENFWLLAGTGPYIYDTARELANRANLDLFLGHTRVVVISKAVAEEGLDKILDFFERHREFTRRFQVVIAADKAKDVFAVQPPITPLASTYIYDILEHSRLSNSFIPRGYNRIIRSLRETGNAHIPRVTPGKTDIKVGGTALIKDWKMVGWLGEEETAALAYMLNEGEGGDIVISGYPEPESKLTFGIEKFKSTIKPKVERGQVRFEIKMSVEGSVAEISPTRPLISLQEIREAELLVAKEIEEAVRATLDKLQSEFQTDVVRFGWLISRYYPKAWEQLQDNWPEEFSRVQVDIDVQVQITSIGMTA